MSVRVNLLPPEAVAQQAAARQRLAIVAGGVLLVGALGATVVWQDGRIGAAEFELAAEKDYLNALRGEQLRLDEFADLATEREHTAELIRTALADEVSMAGILQDVAAVMPSDAEFETLTVTTSAETPSGPDATVRSVGTLTAAGRSAGSHAPGVERLLLEFDKVAGFHDPYLTNSVLEDVEEPYPQFSFQAQLGPEVLTGRYSDGVPEELR
jgi:hypothetical protein